jgi:hypothetical protein
MSDQRNARRRPLTDDERTVLAWLLRQPWREGALDLVFLRQLDRKRLISEKQARRLARVAARVVSPIHLKH